MSLENGNGIENKIEGEQEKFPNKVEIFELLGIDVEKCTVTQEKYDEGGNLYRLDATTEGGNEYTYCRAGEFEGTHLFSTTEIMETTPSTWPTPVWRYENGDWKKI